MRNLPARRHARRRSEPQLRIGRIGGRNRRRLGRWRTGALLPYLATGVFVVLFTVVVSAYAQAHAHAIRPTTPHLIANHATSALPSTDPGAGMYIFTDTVLHTSFTIQTDATSALAGAFTFDTSASVQYHGGQARDLQPHGSSSTLGVHYDGAVQMIVPIPSGAGEQMTSATVHLNATLDLAHLTATVEMTDATNSQHFVLVTAVPGGESAVIAAYNQAVMNRDWATLYTLSSSAITGSLSEAQFAQQMAQDVQTSGAITHITVTSAPQVGSNPAGMTYFTVSEQVTTTLNGAATTQQVNSVYLLENGQWMFWFSRAS